HSCVVCYYHMHQEPYITIAAAALAVGVTRQVLHRQVTYGLIRSHRAPSGRRVVLLSEVIRDRRNNLDPAYRLRLRGQARKRHSTNPTTSQKAPLKPDAIFWIASMTKPVTRRCHDAGRGRQAG